MKTAIATTLSIAGVLAAGGAAFAVNSSVMDPVARSTDPVSVATFPAAPGAVATGATTPAADSSRVSKDGDAGIAGIAVDDPASPTTTATTATTTAPSDPTLAPGSTTTTAPASDLSTTFKVGTAGTVIASARAGVVTIDSVSPAKGWTATRPKPDDGGMELYFTSATSRIEFTVRLVDGRLIGRVDSEEMDDDDRWDNDRYEDRDDDESDHRDDSDHHDDRDRHDEDDD